MIGLEEFMHRMPNESADQPSPEFARIERDSRLGKAMPRVRRRVR